MSSSAGAREEALNRYRGYLRLLAEAEIGRRFQRKFDASDLVQETLLKACRSIHQFRGQSDAEMAAWLRQILARTFLNMTRDLQCGKRDLEREVPLEEALHRSSVSMEELSVAAVPSPSSFLDHHDRLLSVSEALIQLPDDHRTALILRYLRGSKLCEIGAQMRMSRSSVARLLRSALAGLRENLRRSR